MTDLTDERLAEIRALAEAATTTFEKEIRRTSDLFYDNILFALQDYLEENLTFNTAQNLASEKRRTQEFLTLAHRTRFAFSLAAACIESRATAAQARVAELEGVLKELTAACEADFIGGTDMSDEPDDEAVGGGLDGDMAITFGMLRRARAALQTEGRGDG